MFVWCRQRDISETKINGLGGKEGKEGRK